VALLYPDRLYTFVTALITIATLIYLHFVVKVEWIGQASLTFWVLMLGFFPVNGILTGTGLSYPIVNYNPDEFLGIRMITIPIEDAVYGYSQFLLTIYFFKIFQKKLKTAA
jgi:lycopene cyclase domain-containing protein